MREMICHNRTCGCTISPGNDSLGLMRQKQPNNAQLSKYSAITSSYFFYLCACETCGAINADKYVTVSYSSGKTFGKPPLSISASYTQYNVSTSSASPIRLAHVQTISDNFFAPNLQERTKKSLTHSLLTRYFSPWQCSINGNK